MKKIIVIFILIVFSAGTILFFVENESSPPSMPISAGDDQMKAPAISGNSNQKQVASDSEPAIQTADRFQSPLDRETERVTKKPFGAYVSPQNSPVQPERFQGYHTGTDFETFPAEQDSDVSVRAICSGDIALKEYASGYGGILVQNCTLDNQPVTVIYGHLKLASITKNKGDALNAGDTIGILGRGYSTDTNGERKHLHLGVHKGPSINILGYVQSKSQLSNWIDPCSMVCR
jgi:hypothetical protein